MLLLSSCLDAQLIIGIVSRSVINNRAPGARGRDPGICSRAGGLDSSLRRFGRSQLSVSRSATIAVICLPGPEEESYFLPPVSLNGKRPLSQTLRISVERPATYHEAKQGAAEYHTAKQTLIKAFQKAGLGAWVKKPIEQDQFSLNQ
ncbi:hypothetical protein SRHO_G00310080 [Serrasalmus rhombeus]